MATASRFNRGYAGGMAAGSQPGAGYGSSFQSNFQSSMAAPSFASAPKPIDTSAFGTKQETLTPQQPPDFSRFMGAAPAPQAPDMASFFGAAPLPKLGETSFNQQPASPFGGPEPLPPFGGFRARGGPVMPGQAYVVGERGMEMFVPQQPGVIVPNQAMRSPMAATDSPMNRNYGGGLADRAATPVGRSDYDLNRIAQRRFRQTGDPNMMMSMDYRNLMRERIQAPNMPVPQDPALPAPPMPSGRLVPGRSAGSMVWQPDAMPAMPEQRAGMPALPAAPASRMPAAPMGDASMPQSNALSFTMPLLPPALTPQGGLDIMQPLPASTLGGGAGTPPPPAVDVMRFGNTGYGTGVINGKPVGNTIAMPESQPAPFVPTPEQVKQFGLMPDFSKTTVHNGQHYPAWKAGKQQEETVKIYDATGKSIDHPAGYEIPPGWTELKKKGDAPAVPNMGAKAGGAYFDNLMKPTATPAGAPTAMVTGQMPNVAYANDLSPEQSLAAAREDYARTGNDASLKQHFQNFPSASVQKYQQASNLMNQLGQQVESTTAEAQQRSLQQNERNAYINKYSTPFTAGAIASEYESNFPDRVNLLLGPAGKANYQLMEEAMRLSREADMAAGRASPVLPPARIPLPPALAMTQAERNPGGLMARLNRLPIPAQTLRVRPAY